MENIDGDYDGNVELGEYVPPVDTETVSQEEFIQQPVEEYVPPVEETYNEVIDEVTHQDIIQPINEITQEEIIMEETLPIQEEVVIVANAPESEPVHPASVHIKVCFPKSATPVDCVSATTGQSDKIVAANKQLALLQNRFYFIPVDCDITINSDEYSVIKVYSEYAAAIDVKYVKNGVACIMPLKHNFKIRQDMVIAILF